MSATLAPAVDREASGLSKLDFIGSANDHSLVDVIALRTLERSYIKA